MTRAQQRRELQSSITRTRILDKASTLFWQKGYHSTSMRDIAQECGFRAANIYHYYESKEDILYEVIRDITMQTVSSIKHLEHDESTSPEEQLRSLIKSHFGLIAGMKRSSVLISDTGLKDLTPQHRKEIVSLRDRYDAIMRRVVRRGMAKGSFAVKDERIVCFLIASVIMRSNIWYSPRGKLSGDEIGDIMFDFVLRGITAGDSRG